MRAREILETDFLLIIKNYFIMMRILATTLVLGFLTLTAVAQHNVILQSNGETTIFSSSNGFIDAYNAAVDGDTIYLPGLQYSSPGDFAKSLTVFGTGYHPDHTEATGRTRISGFRFRDGSSASHFEGMYVSGSIQFAADLIEDVTLKRMHVNSNILFYRTSTDQCKECNSISIIECVFEEFDGRYADITNLNVFNSIFQRILYVDNSSEGITNVAWFANNTIIRHGPLLNYVYNSLFENNIFIRHSSSVFSTYHGNTFINNVFDFDPTANEENTFISNYENVDRNEFFIEFPGSTYDYDNNYYLADPATYQGNTGNQVGIFGGLNPFKENTRPSNPQIITKNIESSTDEDGNLGVEIEVQAQEE